MNKIKKTGLIVSALCFVFALFIPMIVFAAPATTRVELWNEGRWDFDRPSLKGHKAGNGDECDWDDDTADGLNIAGGDDQCQRFVFSPGKTAAATEYYGQTGRLLAFDSNEGDDEYYTDLCFPTKGAFYNGEEGNNDNAVELGETPNGINNWKDYVDWLAESESVNEATRGTAQQIVDDVAAGEGDYLSTPSANCDADISITPWPARQIRAALDFVEDDYLDEDPDDLTTVALVMYKAVDGGSNVDKLVGYAEISTGSLNSEGKIRFDVFGGNITQGNYRIGTAVLKEDGSDIDIDRLEPDSDDSNCDDDIDKGISTWNHDRGWCRATFFKDDVQRFADEGTTLAETIQFIRDETTTSEPQPDEDDSDQNTDEVQPTCETRNSTLSFNWVLCGILSAVDNLVTGGDGTGGLLGLVDNLLELDTNKFRENAQLRQIWSYFRAIASFALVAIGLAMVISQALGRS